MGRKRTYTNTVIKKLFSENGILCCNPNCGNSIFQDDILIADIAHIRDLNKSTIRYDKTYPEDKINSVENLIVLCKNCHVLVDKKSINYSVQLLESWKENRLHQQLETLSPEQLNKAIVEFRTFYIDIKQIQDSFPDDIPKYKFNMEEDLDYYLNEQTRIYKALSNLHEIIVDDYDKLQAEIESFLNSIDWNKEKYNEIPNYKNPLSNRLWEILNMGLQNWFDSLIFNNKILLLKLIESCKDDEDLDIFILNLHHDISEIAKNNFMID